MTTIEPFLSLHRLIERQSSDNRSETDRFLDLIADPFQSQLQVNSIYASLIWSLVGASSLFLLFVLLRPRISHIYACRSKHADEKHAPPRLQRTLLGWLPALSVKEQQLVYKIGLDAVVFLRFLRMLRNLLVVLTVLGLAVVIPVNVAGVHTAYHQYGAINSLLKLTPQYSFGRRFWAYVVLAYVFQGVICGFVWWNYRIIIQLRQAYLRSDDYVNSLHSRTLLVRHLPQDARSDSAIAETLSNNTAVDELPSATIGRNVRKWNLPELIEKHNETVRTLERHLAKYLADPQRRKRPTCKPFKSEKNLELDANGKVDAITYLEDRRIKLATEIIEARKAIDQRNPESYGFASYRSIKNAHTVAQENRHSKTKRKFLGKKYNRPDGVSIELSPTPNDILWQNLSMTRARRRHRAFLNSIWMTLLTILFIGPNILTAVFLSNFSNLGQLWPAFQKNLQAHPVGWGIAQGILAPSIQFLFYLMLPHIFRKLLEHSGDPSRTSRERHVLSSLYTFYVVNQLIVFSIFATVVRYVSAVVASKDKNVWHAIKNGHLFTQLMAGLCSVSTYWLTWQLQQNLSSAADVSQILSLFLAWFKKKFTKPTPRQLIELSAPQPIDYATYYNAYLFSVTVGLCFATLQPVILPATLFFLGVEYWFKKYLVQYVLFTKNESGGAFWRVMINRLLFAAVLSNAVVALIVGSQGVGGKDAIHNGSMLYAMVPLPFLMLGFKYYLLKHFDSKMGFLVPQSADSNNEDLEGVSQSEWTDAWKGKEDGTATQMLSVRFGHPALFEPLIAPMVHARPQHLVADVLGHIKAGDTGLQHLTVQGAPEPYTAYDGAAYQDDNADISMASFGRHASNANSDAYSHNIPSPYEYDAQHGQNDSTAALVPAIVLVPEAEPDFERYKDRPEFRDEFGGEGQLYGEPEDGLLGHRGDGPVRQ